MKYTAEERVQKGIQWLDGSAQRGKISIYWRNKISLKDLRIADWSKTVVGQLFDGDYKKGFRQIGLYIPYDGCHLGFVNYPRPYRDYTSKLRKAWEEALKTQPSWNLAYTNDNYISVWTRTVNGVRYVIHEVGDSFTISYKLAGNLYISNTYKSIDSAKRAVRKLCLRR
jgi:hypothetical protein